MVSVGDLINKHLRIKITTFFKFNNVRFFKRNNIVVSVIIVLNIRKVYKNYNLH